MVKYITAGQRTNQKMSFRPHEIPEVSLEEKVVFLGSLATYPELTVPVEMKETHMSCVFLAGGTVLKLKKPAKYPFLDFSTIAAREFNCREEIRLNRRLAPDIYIGVVPLTLEPDGKLALNGVGEVVDWLVKMRRLPADRMLDSVIKNGTITRVEVEAVADRLAAFYERTMPEFDLPQATLGIVLRSIQNFVARDSRMLLNRVENGHIIEGHGDLRPQHVCLVDPPVIIDCLEFNRSLRLVDPFDELTFLGLECELLGASWIGNLLIERCADALGGAPDDRLLAFYAAFRATLRARLALAHLLELEPRQPEKWVPRAKQYLAIAERAVSRMAPQADLQ
jgi:aminoglycoside phosphotransferase family enzyme